jgi:hypothetical protein
MVKNNIEKAQDLITQILKFPCVDNVGKSGNYFICEFNYFVEGLAGIRVGATQGKIKAYTQILDKLKTFKEI